MYDEEMGWVEVDGGWYYYLLNGTKATGWKKIDGDWYYFNYPGGSMGWSKVVDEHYLGADGKRVAYGWVNTDKDNYGTWYFVGSDEKVVKGWNRIDGEFYYFNYPGGSMTYDNTIDGFYLENSGKMVNGTGWLQDGITGNWYYYSDGEMATGWKKYGDSWYYLNDDGTMATGVQDIDGDTYYFYSDGEMGTGWEQDSDNIWHYFYDNGSMAHDLTVGGYHVAKSGKMVTGTGWQCVDGSWYYLNNDRVATDWLNIDGLWYYFYPQGSMAEDTTVEGYYLNDSGKWVITGTGWVKIGDDWCYFSDSGKKLTNTWIQSEDGEKWYYVDSDGKMKTTDYIEYGNGRKIYFHQDGTAFEFDYDGGDAEYNDDVTNAITFIPGGIIGKAGKAVIKDVGKTIIKDIEKESVEYAGKDVVKGVSNAIEDANGSINSEISVQHAVGNANQAQSVLDGINPKYFNSSSRFGGGFYVGGDSDTIVAELAEHGNTAKYAISYDMDLSGQKVLDLTNPEVASEWNYVQNVTSTKECQGIGELAQSQGYTVVEFQSYRGSGVNYVIYDNFKDILSARMVTPVD